MVEESGAVGGRVLLRAAFDPRLQVYGLITSAIAMVCTVIGIPFLVPWLLGLGPYVLRRQYLSLEAELTERSLNVRKGFLFRLQKNVPLDKITDLAVREGPILRRFGLCSLRIETAGGGADAGTGSAHLTGVVEALAFRDAVLRQRDRVTDFLGRGGGGPKETEVSGEILATLQRIEALLRERAT